MADDPANGSEFNGFQRFSINELDAYNPLDTGVVRDIIVNNQEGLYNADFKVRANGMMPTGQMVITAPALTVPGNSTYYQACIGSYGPFPLSRLKNGRFAPLYVEVAAATAGDINVSTFNIKVYVVPATHQPDFSFSSQNIVLGDGFGSQWSGKATFSSSALTRVPLDAPNGLLTVPDDYPYYQDFAMRPAGNVATWKVTDTVQSTAMVRLDVYWTMTASLAITPNTSIAWYGLYARENPWRIE